MKTSTLLIVAVLALVSVPLLSRELPGRSTAITSHSYKTESNDCNMPTSQFAMDINNVRATLLDGGDSWYDMTTSAAGYEVPKGPRGTVNPNAIYTGSIWVSGLDAGNNLKIAAQMYRQNGGTDYYSGPLDNTGNTALATCNKWDAHFPVWGTQIRGLIAAYQSAIDAGGTPGSIHLSASAYSDSIRLWPGKGNPYLAAMGYDVTGPLAPFYDVDGDGIYDPAQGDYPTIIQGGIAPIAMAGCGGIVTDSARFIRSTAYGDEMVYWVFNDKGNVHNGTQGGIPIGIQVNALSFAFISGDQYNDMTFYRYQIVNKSGATLSSTYISQFTDPDLGCPYNDMVGCDTSRQLAYVYNGAPQNTAPTPGYSYVCDQTGSAACSGGVTGYGCDLPVLGIALIETPSDTATYPDPAGGSQRVHRQLGMTSCGVIYNTSTAVGDPQSYVQFRNYQQSRWKDGAPFTYGGTGYHSSTTRTNFIFPGDPANASQWSECHSQTSDTIYAGDRRILQSCGPLTFLPCASQFLTTVVTFTRPVNSNCPSLSAFTPAADSAIQIFKTGYGQVTTGTTTLLEDALKLYPNPVNSDLLLSGTKPIDEIKVYDLTGRLVQTQAGSDIRSIDMSALTEGVYMVSVKSGGKTSTQKIAKR